MDPYDKRNTGRLENKRRRELVTETTAENDTGYDGLGQAG